MLVSCGKRYRVSVTALADFACRQGDLNVEVVAGPSAKEGIRAHQRLQKEARDASSDREQPIETEVRLQRKWSIGEHTVEINGRLDMLDRTLPRLSEIKTTLVPSEQLPDAQIALQWAQLSLYAFLYLPLHVDINGAGQLGDGTNDDNGDSAAVVDPMVLDLELVHLNIRSTEQQVQRRQMTPSEITAYAHRAITIWLDWQLQVDKRREHLCHSARSLKFPHAGFRPGQRELSVAVYCAARGGQRLMCEAPTGIGKTISTLFPAVKAMGEKRISQISYLTAKVAGRRNALSAMQRLQASGLRINAIQIRAKKSTCFCSNGRCERDVSGRCPMTLGFFDRLPAARQEAMQYGVLDDEQLDEISWQHQLCPFELVLQLLPWVHLVIADYNYVFDPLVRLQHYAQPRRQDLLLIDESHNLPDRSRTMHSATLDRFDCLAVALECRQYHPVLAHHLDRLADRMLTLARRQNHSQATPGVSVYMDDDARLTLLASAAVEALLAERDRTPVLPEIADELFLGLCRFVAISEIYGEQHRRIIRSEQQGRRRQVTVTLFCLDASRALHRQLQSFKAVVTFSATLRPAVFYRDALGMPEETRLLQLPSPFDPGRMQISLVDWIDTRYHQRTGSVAALVSLIHGSCIQRCGNYLVFLPSYTYLEEVYNAFVDRYPGMVVWRQEIGESRESHAARVAMLDKPGHRIGFVIVGGVYGEGVDYRGDRLIGVIVVGPALPALDEQGRLIAQYHESRGYDGFDLTFRYPGLTRVLQAIGRLIRTEHDAGFALLVDPRFRTAFYRHLFPRQWHVECPGDLDELCGRIDRFWRSLPQSASYYSHGKVPALNDTESTV